MLELAINPKELSTLFYRYIEDAPFVELRFYSEEMEYKEIEFNICLN